MKNKCWHGATLLPLMLLIGASRPTPSYNPSADPAVQVEFEPWKCNKCVMCGSMHHELVPDANGHLGGAAHSCVFGESCQHSTCTAGAMSIPEKEAVRLALRRQDYAGLLALMKADGRIVRVPERGAIQLLDCNNEVAAHFPIPERMLAGAD
jgi:hypothetical protein